MYIMHITAANGPQADVCDTVIYHSPVKYWRSKCVSVNGLQRENVGSGALLDLLPDETNIALWIMAMYLRWLNICSKFRKLSKFGKLPKK